jgi:hypothetical protein
MNYFINFDVNTGISINSYRQAVGYFNDSVEGLVDDIVNGDCGCCPLDGAKHALEDGELWAGSDATAEILEELHAAITDFEDRS